MSRSVWKIPYIHKSLFAQFYNTKPVGNVWVRSSSVPAVFINKKIRIYNGIWMLSVNVRSNMIGRKFGEFSISKRIGKIIHLKKKK